MSSDVKQFIEQSASQFVTMEILRVHDLLDQVGVPREIDGAKQSMSQRLEMYLRRPRITYIRARSG